MAIATIIATIKAPMERTMTTLARSEDSMFSRRLAIAVSAHLAALIANNPESASWVHRAQDLAKAALAGRGDHHEGGVASWLIEDFQRALCLESLILRAKKYEKSAPSELIKYLGALPSLENRHFQAGGPPPPATALEMHAYVEMIFNWELDGWTAFDALEAIKQLQAFEHLPDEAFSRPLRELFVAAEQMAIAAEFPERHCESSAAKRL